MQQLEMDFETGVWKELTPETVFHKGRSYVLRRNDGSLMLWQHYACVSDNGQVYTTLSELPGKYQYLELPA